MNVTVPVSKMTTAMQKMVSVVERSQTMPILGNVLVNVADGHMLLTATDLEIELQTSIESATEHESGQITIPAKKMNDIVKALPEDNELRLKQDGNKVVMQSGRSRYVLHTLPADEFPDIDCGPGVLEFNLEANDLRYLLERVQFSMAVQDVRYFLNGILFEIGAQQCRTVATDGHRLAMCSMPMDLNLQENQCIIPRKGVIELQRLLHEDETLAITIGENYIKVVGQDYVFLSKLIEGKYPTYQAVIPKRGDKTIIVSRDEFKRMLTRAAVLSTEKFKGMHFSLRPDKLLVQARNNEHEIAEEEYQVEYQGEDLDIGFNINYFIEIFNVVDAEKVKITLSDGNSSALIEEADDDKSLYVIMPMRL